MYQLSFRGRLPLSPTGYWILLFLTSHQLFTLSSAGYIITFIFLIIQSAAVFPTSLTILDPTDRGCLLIVSIGVGTVIVEAGGVPAPSTMPTTVSPIQLHRPLTSFIVSRPASPPDQLHRLYSALFLITVLWSPGVNTVVRSCQSSGIFFTAPSNRNDDRSLSAVR